MTKIKNKNHIIIGHRSDTLYRRQDLPIQLQYPIRINTKTYNKKLLTGRGKGAGRCERGAKGGMRGAEDGGGPGRSGWGLKGSLTGPVRGNANTCD